MKARPLAALQALGTLAFSGPGWAFCRATTCDPSQKNCARDAASCLSDGKPLFWASSCLQINVQANGSQTQGISFTTAKESVERALNAWLTADCGGGAGPSLDVQVRGPITCAASEYNSAKKNANIVMFRDDAWPYPGSEDALAFTHLVFNADTGELWDADLEINSLEFRFSEGDPVADNDLDSMLTHEMGHMLGLAHTLVENATMFAHYQEGTNTLRTLADDDVSGVCASYAPNRTPSRTSCSPRHGFSDLCGADQPENSATTEGTDAEATAGGGVNKGCAFAAPSARLNWPLASIAALAVLGVGVRRRRSARHQFVSCG